VHETNGIWGTAIEVLGTAALNQGGTPLLTQCRAARLATAAPSATTPPPLVARKHSSSAKFDPRELAGLGTGRDHAPGALISAPRLRR